RLCGDMRRDRVDLLGASPAAGRARRALCGHDGARALQRRALRARARWRTFFLREPARKPWRASPLGLAPLSMLSSQNRRVIASLGQYVYSTAPDEAAVHLYIEGNACMSIGGVNVSVQQKTQYPWDGEIEIRLEPEQPLEFAARLRIPGWCRSARLQIN